MSFTKRPMQEHWSRHNQSSLVRSSPLSSNNQLSPLIGLIETEKEEDESELASDTRPIQNGQVQRQNLQEDVVTGSHCGPSLRRSEWSTRMPDYYGVGPIQYIETLICERGDVWWYLFLLLAILYIRVVGVWIWISVCLSTSMNVNIIILCQRACCFISRRRGRLERSGKGRLERSEKGDAWRGRRRGAWRG